MDASKEVILDLLKRGQTTYRIILIVALVFLAIVTVLGALLAFQNIRAAGQLRELTESVQAQKQRIGEVTTQTESLRAEAHRLRQQQDQSVIASNRRALELKADFADMRQAINGAASAALDSEAGLAAEIALRNLHGARLTLADASTVSAAIANPPAELDEDERLLLATVMALRRHEQSGGQLLADPTTGEAKLTPELQRTSKALRSVRSESPVQEEANLALLRISYILAENNNFSPAHCAEVATYFSRIRKPSVQAQLQRAECLRKTGDTGNAVAAFTSAIRAIEAGRTRADPTPLSGSEADPLVQYQAYHGRGTVKIAATPDDAPETAQDKAMRAAISDLETAIARRRDGGQTEIEIAGTRENIGFAHLRLRNFEQALQNSDDVAAVTSSAWNLVIRQIAADELNQDRVRDVAEEELRYFRRSEVAECELHALLGKSYQQRLDTLLSKLRTQDGPKSCPQQAAQPG